MITQRLLAITQLGADWVLWLLIALSFVSVAIMIERAIFFFSRRLVTADEVAGLLLSGDLSAAVTAVEGRGGMEADVVRAAVEHAGKGPDSVEEVVAARVERFRWLGLLGLLFGFAGVVLIVAPGAADPLILTLNTIVTELLGGTVMPVTFR